jgi:hypothetical protein
MSAGSGYFDAEGVWIYGENDSIALFSDLLNLGENSVSDQFTADRSRLSTLEANANLIYAAASATARNAHFGTPANETQRLSLQNSGAICIRTDTGITESYYATYNASTNPAGASPAGWYPSAGQGPLVMYSRNSTALTIATATNKTLTTGFDLALSNGMTATATTATVPYNGIYEVFANIVWDLGTASNRMLYITRNLSTDTAPAAVNIVAQHFAHPVNNTPSNQVVSQFSSLAQDDVLRLQVLHANGSNLTIATDSTSTPYARIGYTSGWGIRWIGVRK